MAVQDRLNGLRTRFRGCQIVAFADLSTGMVFAASTAEKVAQERLDALCKDAKHQPSGKTAQALSQQVFEATEVPLRAVSIGSPLVTCVVAGSDRGNEALYLLCERDVRLSEIMDAGAAVLSELCEEI